MYIHISSHLAWPQHEWQTKDTVCPNRSTLHIAANLLAGLACPAFCFPVWAFSQRMPACAQGVAPPKTRRSFGMEARVAPLRALLMEEVPEVQREEVWELSPTQLRDRLLALRPLDAPWIARVNQVGRGCCWAC